MGEQYACPCGHRWDALRTPQRAGAKPAICPVCGTAVAGKTMPPVEVGPATRQRASLALQETLAPAEGVSPPRPPRPVPSTLVTLPGYEVISELGRGGMGVVYKAKQVKLNRLVALKMILGGDLVGADGLARFRAEARAVARLQHPNIVHVHEVGEHNDIPYFSLEFCAGGSLDKRLNGTPLAPREAAGLLEILARAMAHAHEQGIVHRDLKPANILLAAVARGSTASLAAAGATRLTFRGVAVTATPKIADFGLAKQLGASIGQTASGAVMGTPSYMAPEQAAGKTREVGPAADIYALGAILYEMLTGRSPFRAASAVETLMQVVHEEPVPIRRLQSGVPRDLETICHKAMARDPRRRYATARELAEDLQRFLSGEPVAARPMGRLERLGRWCRRNPVAVSLLAAVILVAAIGLGHLSSLSEQLVRSAAQESAAQHAEILDDLNTYYSGVVHKVTAAGDTAVQVTPLWQGANGAAMPLPATLTIELGEQITDGKSGVRVRLFSAHPFKSRKDGGPRDDFEREALEKLSQDPSQPVYSFVDYQGKPVLRYAVARRMTTQSCVDCHNTHQDSPKHDWQVGDMRGVLEIIRPLDQDMQRVHDGLRSTFILVGSIGAGLLMLVGLVLVISSRRRAASLTPDSSSVQQSMPAAMPDAK